MSTRRGFLGMLAAGAAGLVLGLRELFGRPPRVPPGVPLGGIGLSKDEVGWQAWQWTFGSTYPGSPGLMVGPVHRGLEAGAVVRVGKGRLAEIHEIASTNPLAGNEDGGYLIPAGVGLVPVQLIVFTKPLIHGHQEGTEVVRQVLYNLGD